MSPWHASFLQSWRDVPILACEEPLVVAAGDRVRSASAYYQIGYREALPDVWVRDHVAHCVERAARMLPPDLTLVLWDGWRPVELQARLYNEYRNEIAAKTGLTGAALERETQKFVSQPSATPTSPSPHLTGGSIDLTLGDADGAPLDMGGEFDELGERSMTAFYERDQVGAQARTYRNRRRLLCAVMTHVGFSNYPEEWWHFDMGNQFHHCRVGGPARYGPVSALPRNDRTAASPGPRTGTFRISRRLSERSIV